MKKFENYDEMKKFIKEGGNDTFYIIGKKENSFVIYNYKYSYFYRRNKEGLGRNEGIKKIKELKGKNYKILLYYKDIEGELKLKNKKWLQINCNL